MFDYKHEKKRILDELSQWDQPEDNAFRQSLLFANQELREFAEALDDFSQQISHLILFQDAIKLPFHNHMSSMIKKLKELLNDETDDQEIESMNKTEYQVYLALQEVRMKLLANIANHYLGGKKE